MTSQSVPPQTEPQPKLAEPAVDSDLVYKKAELGLKRLELGLSVLTPICLLALGFWINNLSEDYKNSSVSNQKIIEWRLRANDQISSRLNDVYCYFRRVGSWKNLTPDEVLEDKRALDKEIYSNRALFSAQFITAYENFSNVCFKTYNGYGEDAQLNAFLKERKEIAFKRLRFWTERDPHKAVKFKWKDDWNNAFSEKDADSLLVTKAYEDLIAVIRKDLRSTRDDQTMKQQKAP